jgi:FKBP-type peptidyl-prolyl cis-trans isomerase FklB
MQSKIILGSLLASAALYGNIALADKPTTEAQQLGYAVGFQIGQGFKRDNLSIDTNTMSQAINDVLAGKTPQLSMEEMRAAMELQQTKVLNARASKGEKAKQAGEDFLAKNKKKDGVISLPSGLQYKVLLTGKGKKPSIDSSITAHYRGKLINGQEFDSSYRRKSPATFNVNQVIAGWKEVLPLMHEGDKWQVFIPAALAYGERGSGATIGPNEALIFDIELIKVN